MKLSFLTACMDRLHHLKETYLYNISQSKSISKCDVEFVLLNYNSGDDIDEWVKLNTQNLDIEFKYLKFSTRIFLYYKSVFYLHSSPLSRSSSLFGTSFHSAASSGVRLGSTSVWFSKLGSFASSALRCSHGSLGSFATIYLENKDKTLKISR